MTLLSVTKWALQGNVHVAGGICPKPDDKPKLPLWYGGQRSQRTLQKEKKMIQLSLFLCILF